MRGRIFSLALALVMFGILAGAGCLMKPYSGDINTTPAANESGNLSNLSNPPEPPPRECTGPVCGADEKTYATNCDAADAQVAILYTGQCKAVEKCTDSDSGLETNVTGTVTKGNESHGDHCLDSSQLVEYSCLDNAITLATILCGEGKECMQGRCADKELQVVTPVKGCFGTHETDIYTRQNVTNDGETLLDACVDMGSVKEYFCQNKTLQSSNFNCPPGYYCTDGHCTKEVRTCTDSDGGNNTIQRGRIQVLSGFKTFFEEWDTCINEGRIREYMCSENNTEAIYQELDCGSGRKCDEGQCIKSSCKETDDGNNLFVAGTTTKENMDYKDECQTVTSVKEFYCFGDGVRSEIAECPQNYECRSGRCVEE